MIESKHPNEWEELVNNSIGSEQRNIITGSMESTKKSAPTAKKTKQIH